MPSDRNLIEPEPDALASRDPAKPIVAESPGTPNGITPMVRSNPRGGDVKLAGVPPVMVYSHIFFASSFSSLSPDMDQSESSYSPEMDCFFSFGSFVYVIVNPPIETVSVVTACFSASGSAAAGAATPWRGLG